jgi:dipeptidyl aminopeptidase B
MQLSKDLKFILLAKDYEPGWRHSFTSNYWLFDIQAKKARPLAQSKSDKVIEGQIGHGKTQLVVWSPEGHNLAWVRDNDVYVTTDSHEFRLTTDGSLNIVNGISDWVYEEEILGNGQSAWFSPTGKALAYIKYNDTLVQEYHLQYYMSHDADIYPNEIDLKYPKPGTPNPVAHLYVATGFDTSNASVPVMVNIGFDDDDRIFTQIDWISDTTFLVRVMNRVQDVQRLYLVTFESSEWSAKLLRDEATPDGAWHNRRQPLRILQPSPKNGRPDHSYLEVCMSKNRSWMTNMDMLIWHILLTITAQSPRGG